MDPPKYEGIHELKVCSLNGLMLLIFSMSFFFRYTFDADFSISFPVGPGPHMLPPYGVSRMNFYQINLEIVEPLTL